MFSVYQHWDPLQTCVVGRSYPPEFYSWIQNSRVRQLFEKIAIETEEDFQKIIAKLKSFGVKIVRPNLDLDLAFDGTKYQAPPMTPRDYMVMIEQTLYSTVGFEWNKFYKDVKADHWPWYNSVEQFLNCVDQDIIAEVKDLHQLEQYQQCSSFLHHCYQPVFDLVRAQGNPIKVGDMGPSVIGSMVTRIGHDLYFGTENYHSDHSEYQRCLDREFATTRNHIVNTGGHSDGTYCPVCPGLIISLYDVPCYADTFPGWEVVYLKGKGWDEVKPFLDLKEKNKGKWWIPGFEYDNQVTDLVETWLAHWTGYVEETVFDINMLMVDPKNVLVFNHNQQVFEALERHGITPHVVTFRHRYFWDGGIHCVTTDLDRLGIKQDFFPRT